jgi:FkbM family methyltransferase
MRLRLLLHPLELLDRLAAARARQRRRRPLRGTPGETLPVDGLDSLELLQLLGAKPPAVIYDVGAHVGSWTRLAKSLYPSARIEAFEPLPVHFGGFRAATAAWTDVRLHRCALGRQAGTATLHVADLSAASSLLPLTRLCQDEYGVRPASAQAVPVEALDELAAREQLPPPDLIKLDVQGFELEALRGGENCLAAARAVLCEVSFAAYYEQQALFPDVLAHLGERGFRLLAFGAATALGAPLQQADALFVRP